MKREIGICFFLTICILLCFPSIEAKYEKILLSQVQTIALTKGKLTAGRRHSGVPQLVCKGGACEYAPQTVMCKNMGSDGVDAIWECTADLPDGVKFGSIEVSCEGYEYPEDPYVLRGSCGLEYTLTGYPSSSTYESNETYRPSGSQGSSWFSLLLCAFVAWVLYKVCCTGGGSGIRGNGGAPPGGPNTFPGSGPSSYGYDPSCGPTYAPGYAPTSSGPGFWSGMGLGGAMGYAMGSRNRPAYQTPYYDDSGFSRSSYRTSSSSSSSSAPSHSSQSAYGGTKRR